MSEIQSAKNSISEFNSKLSDKFEHYNIDVSHQVYILLQNEVSYFSEEISVIDEFEQYYDMIEAFDLEFMPSYPPNSPLTGSYFAY